MNLNLLFDNNLTYYGIFIGCGLILGCSVYYLITSNYTAIPSKNIEALTNEDIEAIVNENAVTIIKNENMDAITDSDSDTDVESDHQTIFGEESDSDESESDVDIADLDLFYMPNVDLEVCSIQELKIFEISSIFYKEIAEHNVTDEELTDLIYYLPEADLFTNKVNKFILHIINNIDM
jgi:hypothetical protein